MKKAILLSVITAGCVMTVHTSTAQDLASDSSHVKNKKNIIRYNLSGAIIFGFSRYVVFGYERVIGKKQSISVNFGKASLPKIVSIDTDSLKFKKDVENTGTNFSIDWRFYLAKENKYLPPHGVYIGPYYSFNGFKRKNEFTFQRASGTETQATTNTQFNIHTIGAELGYQFVLWKRLAIDFVLVGPGMSSYTIKAKFEGNLSDEDREQLRDAIQQIITQKFPGMNYVLGDKEFNASGVLDTWSVGFRYLIHIGFVF